MYLQSLMTAHVRGPARPAVRRRRMTFLPACRLPIGRQGRQGTFCVKTKSTENLCKEKNRKTNRIKTKSR
jgi:hypothetical protein